MLFFPWGWNILVAIMRSVPGTLIFEVLFMIVGLIVLPWCWLWFCYFRCILSQPLIDKSFFLHGIDVHISNWRFMRFYDFSSGCSAPVSLNSFHVPLIYHCYDVFRFEVVKIIKNAEITLIDENLLLFGCRFRKETNQKIDPWSINWFCECLSSSDVKNVDKIVVLAAPARGCVESGHYSSPNKGVAVEIRLESQCFNCSGIKGRSTEDSSSIIFIGVFKGVVSLETRSKDSEILGKSWNYYE